MTKTILSLTLVLSLNLNAATKTKKAVLIIHGGAGHERQEVPLEKEKDFKAGLEAALKAGYEKIKAGNPSLDAVEAAIKVLEDDPLFNAGKGAVFTHDGKNELDASIMDGATLKAGAVANVTKVKNPISAARAVMEKSRHVMLVSAGADAFAKEVGLEIVDPSYFYTDHQWKYLEEMRKKDKIGALPKQSVWSTVGAVARDLKNNIAAGTSTGGLTNKRWGRVGDSPIIGAGTYADNDGIGLSATGHGEYFIRYAVAHDINARVKYQKASLQKAADNVVKDVLKKAGGEGGVITLDKKGNYAASYNCESLFRGVMFDDGTMQITLFE